MSLALIIVLVLIIVIINTKNKEHFDTYYNHDYWAADYYNKTDPSLNPDRKGDPNCNTPECIDAAALKARYDWSEKDADGYDIYDKYYDSVIKNRSYGGDPEYVERFLETGSVYDTKFSTITGNDYAVYKKSEMEDHFPVRDDFNGNMFELNQKNY